MQLLFKLKWPLSLLTVLVCIVLFPYLKLALQVDNSLDIWFLKNDPALVKYKQFQKTFGNDEVVILAVHDKKGVLSPAYLKAFAALSKDLLGRRDIRIKHIIGPANAKILKKELLGYFSMPLYEENSSIQEIKQRLKENQFLRSQFFSPDYTTARILIVPEKIEDFDNKRTEILDEVKKTIYKHLPQDRFYLGGIGIIYSGLNTLSQQDFGFFLFTGYLIMFIVLLLIHRSILTMLYALGTVALSTYLTLAIYGLAGFRLNLMTVLLPIVIILLGIMDVMHIINEFSQLKEGSGKERAYKAMSDIFKPCLFTSLTTIAGFLVSLSSPMPILSNFGLFAALGIFFCLVFTYLLGALLLPYCKPHSYTTGLTASHAVNLLNFVLGRKKLLRLVSILMILVFGLGMTRLKSDTYTLGYFPKDNKVVKDHEAIQKYWGAYLPLELVVKSNTTHQTFSPEIFTASSDFTQSAKKLNGIGSIMGFHSFYNAFLEARYKEKTSGIRKIASALKSADQGLQFFFPEISDQYLSVDRREGRLTVFGKMLTAGQLNKKTDSLLSLSKKHFGNSASVYAAGYQPMYANIVKYVTESQVNSFILSLVLVFVLMLVYIRDVKLSVLALIPNLTPIVVMFGTMGWCNITMDTATASIASIVLGIAIDDTIHYIYHYKNLKRIGISPEEARTRTTAHVVPAIILTGLMLTAGYSFMLLASLKTVMLFGLLTAIAILSGLFSELIIFPLLLQRFDKS